MVTCKANPSLHSYHPFLSFLFKKVQILLDVTGALKPLQRNQESDTQRHHWSLLSSVPMTFFFPETHFLTYRNEVSITGSSGELCIYTQSIFRVSLNIINLDMKKKSVNYGWWWIRTCMVFLKVSLLLSLSLKVTFITVISTGCLAILVWLPMSCDTKY